MNITSHIFRLSYENELLYFLIQLSKFRLLYFVGVLVLFDSKRFKTIDENTWLRIIKQGRFEFETCAYFITFDCMKKQMHYKAYKSHIVETTKQREEREKKAQRKKNNAQ